MKQSVPYFSSMSFRKSAGIFSRPLSSTRAGACPIRTLSSIVLVQRPFLPLFATYVHKFPPPPYPYFSGGVHLDQSPPTPDPRAKGTVGRDGQQWRLAIEARSDVRST